MSVDHCHRKVKLPINLQRVGRDLRLFVNKYNIVGLVHA